MNREVIIEIQHLLLRTRLGVYEHEQAERTVFADVEFVYNAGSAVSADDISQAVDYGKIEQKLIETAGKKHYYLIETLASDLLNYVLTLNAVKSAKVKLVKKGALLNAESVSVVVSGNSSEV